MLTTSVHAVLYYDPEALMHTSVVVDCLDSNAGEEVMCAVHGLS